MEWNKAQIPLLGQEDAVYRDMKGISGIPERKFFMAHGDFLFLGLEMQGTSMEGRLRQCGQSVPLNEVLAFGAHMVCSGTVVDVCCSDWLVNFS